MSRQANRQSTMSMHQQLESVTDLTTLSPVSEDIIVSCIRERFMSDNIYTAIGTSALVAINPHNPASPTCLPARQQCLHHMRRTTQDQSILLSGETGSGKSESRRLAIKTLLELSVSQPGKKGAKLGYQVPAAEFVLEAFGNSRTLFNPNASHFGKYTELQFTERGRLSGVKTLDYYLERSRVAGAPSGERNFHIFYYLVAGASAEERQHMHLPRRRSIATSGSAGLPVFVGIKNVGFSKRHVAQTCQLIAAILHLGNLEFTIDRHRNEDAAVVRNTDVLDIVADFLGVQSSALEATLSYRTKLMKKELCTVFLDPDGASDNRDELAKTLYSLLFAWLNEHINQRLCRDDFTTFIGLFDLPGPQNMTSRPNSLDQFCGRLPTFTINHFSGPVTYTSDGFLEKNLDALNPDFVSLLRGSTASSADAPAADGTGSINPFVRGLFSAKAIATQAHPRNEDTIVSAQQPVKPMRAPSTRRKNTIKRMPTLKEGDVEEKDRDDEETAIAGSSGGAPCVAGEFRSALDVLFETLEDTQSWYVFCINPNDSQLPNQLEGRSVKAQVRSAGLAEITRRCVTVFEVTMTPDEFVSRYKDLLATSGVPDGDSRAQAEQARDALDLEERDIVLGLHMVFLSQAAFHRLEDDLRSKDTEEQKRNRLRDAEAEAGLDPRGLSDPYAPYQVPGGESPYEGGNDDYGQSSQALPLVSNASPFQRGDAFDDYDERKSLRSEDFDGRSAYTSARDGESVSNFGTESYAPSRNMFQNADKKGLLDKEALAGEIQEGEVAEVLKESSARRRWVALCWMLTFWCPTFLLRYVGRMKRIDIQQAWREKLALNMIIWFVCGCAVFVIAIISPIICPTEHVFNAAELASHSFNLNPNNVYTSIRGEVFDLTAIAETHERIVSVVPSKSILKYGGTSSDNIFPVQVSALCNGINGTVSPYVVLSSANVTDPNAQYHDFRAWTNDPRPDWYFEQMVQMRWNNRVGFVGYSPKQIKSMASGGSSVAISKVWSTT
ncbi:Chitin synthase 8 [Grifola frondosa]|uniref:Chitin synthase 8 n=1 Tax=Grifola frondosa TaxID=5627 RepID=A0A1C7MGP3_GRIFR|nr:Chitin synthase 8 [Grifola frondosa]